MTQNIDTYRSLDNFSKTNNFDGINPLFYVGYSITDAYLYPPSTVQHNNFNSSDNYTYTADNASPMSNSSLSYNTSAGSTTVYMPNIKTFATIMSKIIICIFIAIRTRIYNNTYFHINYYFIVIFKYY